jgi:hypothetical protein
MDLSYNIAANLPFQVGNTPMHGASSSTTEEINRRSSKKRKKSAERSIKERKRRKHRVILKIKNMLGPANKSFPSFTVTKQKSARLEAKMELKRRLE